MVRKSRQRYWQYCSANGHAIFGLALSLCMLSSVEAAVTALCVAQTTAAIHLAQDALPLEPGKPIEREIAVGESHAYQFTLDAGQYLHAEIEQYGINVAVTLFDPTGKRLLYFTDWEKGAESVHWIGETDGSYQLKIQAEPSTRQTPTGRYQVRMIALRPAQPSDDYPIAARQAFKAAEELRNLEQAAALATLVVANGGTGATTAASARSNLGAAAKVAITGATIPLAKITPGGTDSSITVNAEGIVTAYVAPT